MFCLPCAYGRVAEEIGKGDCCGQCCMYTGIYILANAVAGLGQCASGWLVMNQFNELSMKLGRAPQPALNG